MQKKMAFHGLPTTTMATILALMQHLPAVMTDLCLQLLQMTNMTKMKLLLSPRMTKISIKVNAKLYLPAFFTHRLACCNRVEPTTPPPAFY
jgi:hypothetical protein